MPAILVEVCAGTQCTIMGAMDIINAVESLCELNSELGPGLIEVRPIPCNRECHEGVDAPVVFINGEILRHTDSESVMERIIAISARQQPDAENTP